MIVLVKVVEDEELLFEWGCGFGSASGWLG